MSHENVDVVRRSLEALLRGDMDAVLAEIDPEVEIGDLDIELDTDRFRGHDGYLRWLATWNESWDKWRLEELEILPVGEERVIALFVMFVTGKGSGIELDRKDAVTFRLR